MSLCCVLLVFLFWVFKVSSTPYATGVILVLLVLVQQTGDNDSYAFVGELGVF